MKYAYLLLLVIFPRAYAQDQDRKPLRGKVSANTSNFAELFVVNRQSEQAVAVEDRGYFTIAAKTGDTLQFSSTRFRARQVRVKPDDFNGDLLLVELQAMIQLEEVVLVRHDKINAVDLGILPKEPKKYTPAERRLQTAGDLKPQDFLGLLGGGMPADPIINAISGRTARLKKEIEIEKKETFMKQIEELFDETFFTGNLKLPAIYVKGFLYFVVENDSFTRLLVQRNKTTLAFLMTQLAEKYKETICEPE